MVGGGGLELLAGCGGEYGGDGCCGDDSLLGRLLGSV
jgi:hypothetical protein